MRGLIGGLLLAAAMATAAPALAQSADHGRGRGGEGRHDRPAMRSGPADGAGRSGGEWRDQRFDRNSGGGARWSDRRQQAGTTQPSTPNAGWRGDRGDRGERAGRDRSAGNWRGGDRQRMDGGVPGGVGGVDQSAGGAPVIRTPDAGRMRGFDPRTRNTLPTYSERDRREASRNDRARWADRNDARRDDRWDARRDDRRDGRWDGRRDDRWDDRQDDRRDGRWDNRRDDRWDRRDDRRYVYVTPSPFGASRYYGWNDHGRRWNDGFGFGYGWGVAREPYWSGWSGDGWGYTLDWLRSDYSLRNWVMLNFDRDRNGYLDRWEGQWANQAFAQLADRNRNGSISRSEYRDALRALRYDRSF